MKEIIRTNDRVVIGLAQALLQDEDIIVMVLDDQAGMMLGNVYCRLLVSDEQETKAREILTEAGMGNELRDA